MFPTWVHLVGGIKPEAFFKVGGIKPEAFLKTCFWIWMWIWIWIFLFFEMHSASKHVTTSRKAANAFRKDNGPADEVMQGARPRNKRELSGRTISSKFKCKLVQLLRMFRFFDFEHVHFEAKDISVVNEGLSLIEL